MNYDHTFHAGSFADIYKHSIFLDIIQKIQESYNTAVTIYDMHAGSQLLYNMYSIASLRSGEFLHGIIKLHNLYQKNMVDIDIVMSNFYNIVLQVNNHNILKLYPGSSYITCMSLRCIDQAILFEKNIKHYNNLCKDIIKYFPRSNIQYMLSDAWRYNLAPNSNQGYKIILLDPAFEDINEVDNIANFLNNIKNIDKLLILIWYPVKNHFNYKNFDFLKNFTAVKNKVIYEVCKTSINKSLSGTGMILLSNDELPSYYIFSKNFSYHLLDEGQANQYHL